MPQKIIVKEQLDALQNINENISEIREEISNKVDRASTDKQMRSDLDMGGYNITDCPSINSNIAFDTDDYLLKTEYDINGDGIVDLVKNVKYTGTIDPLYYYGTDATGNIGFFAFPIGIGDMQKAVYDANDDGVVDDADNASTATSTALSDVADAITAVTGSTDKYYGTSAGTKGVYTFTDLMPSGGIIIWSGSIANIPSGWYICDGANGTPNLADRFILHADGVTNLVDDTGTAAGSTSSDAISAGEMPLHRHTYSMKTTTQTGLPGGGVPGMFFAPSVSVDTQIIGSSGGGITHDHSVTSFKPKYYALAYIMKA